MEVAYISAPKNMYGFKNTITDQCKCEKISREGKKVTICDVCSERNFLKKSSSMSYITDSSTFTDD